MMLTDEHGALVAGEHWITRRKTRPVPSLQYKIFSISLLPPLS